MTNPTMGELVTSTLRNRKQKRADTITKHNGVMYELRQRGRIMMEAGGRTISCPILYGYANEEGYYSGDEQLTFNGSEVLTSAEYSWKQWARGVKMTGLLGIQNDGPYKLHGILMSRIEAAEKGLANLMAAGVHSDGTGAAGKEIGGLGHLNPISGALTVGGIPMNTTAWWNNIRKATGGVTSSTIEAHMLDLHMKTTRQTDRVNLIVSDDSYYQTYYMALRPDQRQMNPRMAKGGFDNIDFRGIPVIADGYRGGFAPPGMHFLNLNVIALRMYRKRNNVPLPGAATRPIDQDVEHVLIVGAGNMTLENMFLNGRMTD